MTHLIAGISSTNFAWKLSGEIRSPFCKF